MKIFRKTLLITVLALNLLFNVAFASAFTDISSQNKYAQAINSLTEKGVIKGYADGTFRPENEINRAEFLTITIASETSNPAGENCFSDVGREWFAAYVCYAKTNKMVSGYPDGSFKPASNINLAEALAISLGGNLKASAGEAWYEPYLKIAQDKNYLKNINKDLSHEIERGEAAQLIYNIMNPPDDVVSSDGTTPPDTGPDSPPDDIPSPTYQTNAYSWDGSFAPKSSDFPIAGLFDSEYPDLPPGKWDWSDTEADKANYRNFTDNIGTFEALKDSKGNQFGWKLIGNNPDSVDYAGAADYFEGSPGTDILNLGKNGQIHSFGEGNLGDGPDILVFDKAWSLDFRTGSSLKGSKNDNDLVIAGCNANTDSSFDISGATIHTGPGSDLVFVRDMERAAIDAGNGDGGDTSVIDPNDGNDTVIYRGNMLDFRFFGGKGNDTAVWYVDEVDQEATWLGPDFFGGGGAGDAIWGDKGIDTLVLVIPPDAKITDTTPLNPGELLVRIPYNYSEDIVWDAPMNDNIYARYCISCGISSENKKTLTLEYLKKDGKVETGYFSVNDFERLQLGIGKDAKVYDLDQVNGKAILNPDLPKHTPPDFPEEYCL